MHDNPFTYMHIRGSSHMQTSGTCMLSTLPLQLGQLIHGEASRRKRLCVNEKSGLVAKIPSLESDHEEADTRFMLHAHNASNDHLQVIVQSIIPHVEVL